MSQLAAICVCIQITMYTALSMWRSQSSAWPALAYGSSSHVWGAISSLVLPLTLQVCALRIHQCVRHLTRACHLPRAPCRCLTTLPRHLCLPCYGGKGHTEQEMRRLGALPGMSIWQTKSCHWTAPTSSRQLLAPRAVLCCLFGVTFPWPPFLFSMGLQAQCQTCKYPVACLIYTECMKHGSVIVTIPPRQTTTTPCCRHERRPRPRPRRRRAHTTFSATAPRVSPGAVFIVISRHKTPLPVGSLPPLRDQRFAVTISLSHHVTLYEKHPLDI